MAENNLIENGRLVYCKSHWIGARSGLMTVIAADAFVWALRNSSVEELVVTKLMIEWLTTASFTAAQGLAFAAYKATGMTAFGATGGIIPNPTRKRVGDHTVLGEFEAAISNTAALANVTATIDNDDPFAVLSTSLAVPTTASINFGEEVWTPGNQVPITLGTNEGIVITVQNTMAAGGVGRLYVGADVHRA
jgi:hypothetical protein